MMQVNKDKPKLLRRLKIIEGQVKGIQGMITQDIYCINIITQTSAVKQALSNVEDMLIENHLQTCLQHQMKTGQINKATNEIVKVYKLKRK